MGLCRLIRGALVASLRMGMVAGMSGCPTRDRGLALIPSQSELDYGRNATTINLTIKTNFSTTTPEPLTLQSSAPWISVPQCTDASEACLVGSLLESITIPITIDRGKTTLGANRATLTLNMPGASQLIVPVYVEDLLLPEFNTPSRRVGVGQSVPFNNSSAASDAAGAITGYTWDFGDGTTSTQASPVHVYASPGVYSVSLTVQTATGSETRTRGDYVVVGDPQPRPDFSANLREIFEGESVQFTDKTTSNAGPILSRNWDFGDGAASNAVNPSHQYRKSGLYTVTLSVETEFATVAESKTAYILVKRRGAPEAFISVSTVQPVVGDIVQFNDASIPGSSPITGWIWNFGDGAVSTQQNPTHVYQQAGTFTITLKVLSAHGSDETTVTLPLEFAAPKPDFEVLNTNPSTCSTLACPEAIQFIDRSSPGSGAIREWLWDFGDGETSTEQNPKHGYRTVGTFSVTLTITTTAPSNNTASITKQNLIVSVDPPRPDFSIGTRSAFVNTPVQFTNRTRIGTETNVTYQWDFDGRADTVADTSTQTNPVYTYTAAGTFNPTLTASTPTRSEKASQPIIVDGVSTANFNASTRTPTTAETVQFTDTSALGARGAGGTPTVVERRWDLGDGTISTVANPTHRYRATGTYSVSLTITVAHSGSGVLFTYKKTEANYITVRLPDPPVADFDILNTDCVFTGDTLEVAAVQSDEIDAYLWNFGDPDGAGNVAGTPDASHLYDTPGVYTVSLTVTDSDLDPPLDKTTITRDIVVADLTDLDVYVREEDPAFSFQQNGSSFNLSVGLLNAGTAFNLYMFSGDWRSSADFAADDVRWHHNVTVIDPANRKHDTALLTINGSDRDAPAPTQDELSEFGLPELVLATGAPMVVLDGIPNQPLRFVDDPEDLISRSEDALIAASFDKYLEDFDADRPIYPAAADPWPVLHVMARAAVRAMDASQTFMSARNRAIEDFIVTGASKRGWTTWLTAITDCRIKAFAPIVFDTLNIVENFENHRRSLATQNFFVTDGYTDAVVDYTRLGIFDRLSDPDDEAGEALLALVDPYEYRERTIQPKYIINGSGDEFFLSDSAQYYIDDLPGETNLTYIPNAGHGLGNDPFNITNTDSPLFVLTSWLLGVLQGVERPKVNWAFPDDNTIVVNLDDPSGESPVVRLWSINNNLHRDFRKPITDGLGRTWTSQLLTPQPDGSYRGTVSTPAAGWTAYYIQVRFDSDAELQVNVPGLPQPEFVFSTPIRVVPNVYPTP